MINSVFILNDLGHVIAEKHWRGLINRGICDALWDAVTHAENVLDVPPIIPAHTGQHHLFNIVHFVTKQTDSLAPKSMTEINNKRREKISRATAAKTQKIFLVAVAATDVNVMVPLEFLHRMEDAFEDYFGVGFSEVDLQEEFARVYMMLEEMADNGDPSCTEPAILRTFVPAPHMFGAIGEKLSAKVESSSASENSMSSMGTLPGIGGGGAVVSVPWRRTGIKYTSNEFFLDLVEDVDCIVEPNGTIVTAGVSGNVYANCRLSGMPDLTLNFVNPALLDDVSLHPCVRVFRWEKNRIISFVPPDGRFKLMSYRVRGAGIMPPLDIHPNIKFENPSDSSASAIGKLEVSVTLKPIVKSVVEDIVVSIPLPKSATGVLLTATCGSFDFDSKIKTVVWTIGKWNPANTRVSISGTISMAPGFPAPECSPPVSAQFKISMYTASGIRVDSLNVRENYSRAPYKGVRSVTRGGNYYFRT